MPDRLLEVREEASMGAGGVSVSIKMQGYLRGYNLNPISVSEIPRAYGRNGSLMTKALIGNLIITLRKIVLSKAKR